MPRRTQPIKDSIEEGVFAHAEHSQPKYGLRSTHTWGEIVGIVPNMGVSIDEILAENLTALMTREGSPLPSNKAVEKKSKVGQATIDRARKSQPGLSIAKLEALARAFDLEPWQLLYPGLDPAAPPRIAGSAVQEEQWPLHGVLPAEFELIPPEEKEEVLSLVRLKVARHRPPASPQSRPRKKA